MIGGSSGGAGGKGNPSVATRTAKTEASWGSPGASFSPKTPAKPRFALQMMGAFGFKSPARRIVERNSLRGQPSYLYAFNHNGIYSRNAPEGEFNYCTRRRQAILRGDIVPSPVWFIIYFVSIRCLQAFTTGRTSRTSSLCPSTPSSRATICKYPWLCASTSPTSSSTGKQALRRASVSRGVGM